MARNRERGARHRCDGLTVVLHDLMGAESVCEDESERPGGRRQRRVDDSL